MSRLTAQHWVFDMDGTLTRAIHDFALMRRKMEIPEGIDILAHLEQLPADEAQRHYQWLHHYELKLARQAQAATGIADLLQQLRARGVSLGLLTRNAASLARLTLECAGLSHFFSKTTLLGRDDAAPKPNPEGLERLAAIWQIAPSALVMVGDSIIDIQTGQAAGAYTILLHSDNAAIQAQADLALPDAAALLAQL